MLITPHASWTHDGDWLVHEGGGLRVAIRFNAPESDARISVGRFHATLSMPMHAYRTLAQADARDAAASVAACPDVEKFLARMNAAACAATEGAVKA
jgi:hypothetical protein